MCTQVSQCVCTHVKSCVCVHTSIGLFVGRLCKHLSLWRRLFLRTKKTWRRLSSHSCKAWSFFSSLGVIFMTSNSLYWYRHLFLGITLQFIQRDIYYYTLGTTSASSPFKCTSRNYLYTVFRTVFRTIHCSGCTVPGTINHKQVYGLVSHHIEKHHIWFLCTMDIENQIVNETMTVRSGVFGWNSVPPELNSPVRTIMLWFTIWFSASMMKRNQMQRKTLETLDFKWAAFLRGV